MAITQLASGQLANAASPAVPSGTVNVLPGSNRMFLCCVMGEFAGAGAVVVPIPTLGGVPLPRLNDGVFAGAVALFSNPGAATRTIVSWYALRELEYPGAGNQALNVPWANGASWAIAAHWWQLQGVAQPATQALNVQNAWFSFTNSPAATSVSGTRPAGLADDAVFWAVIKKGFNNILTMQIDGGSNPNEFADIIGAPTDLIQYRAQSSKTLAAPVGAGTTAGAFSASGSVSQAAIVIGARLRAAVAPNPGQAVLTYREPWSVAAEWTQ